MIELDIRTAFLLYSAALGVLVLFIWIYTEISVHRPQRYLGKQFLWRCIICGYIYLDEEGELYSECPRCGSINSEEDKAARFVPQSPAARELARKTAAQPHPEDNQEKRRNPSQRKRPNQRRRGPRRH